MDAIASYLQPGRLADVLALIQVLAYDRDSYRTEDGLDDELQRKPSVGDTWMALANATQVFSLIGLTNLYLARRELMS